MAKATEVRCTVCHMLLRDEGFTSSADSDVDGVPVCLDCIGRYRVKLARDKARPELAAGDLNALYDLAAEAREDLHAIRWWAAFLGIVVIVGIIVGLLVMVAR